MSRKPSRTTRTALGTRSHTTPRKKLTREALLREWFKLGLSKAEAESMAEGRPSTRAECVDAPRPCPWVACRHHLYLDVNPRTGSIKINFPDLEPWELRHTCALDVADSGAKVLEDVGEIMNLTRERVRQVEVMALTSTEINARERGMNETDLDGFVTAPGITEPEILGRRDLDGFSELLDARLKEQGSFSPLGWKKQ